MHTKLILLLFSFLVISCSQEVKNDSSTYPKKVPTIEIPNQQIDKSKLKYNNKTSLWTLDGERFSGFAIRLYPDSTLQQKFGVFEGQKQNQSLDWYPDGALKYSANYHQGKLHGIKKSWTRDSTHVLIAQLNYRSGKAHGHQKKWYPTGELFKVLHLNMGKEEGIQQAFRKNGYLYTNYEARNGKIYGLKRSALCYELEDETIQYEK